MSIDKEIIKHVQKQLKSAATYLTGQVKKNLNAQGTPKRVSNGPSGPHYKNLNPSPPGGYPHKMLGDLQRSITYEMFSPNEARVGTNVEYGKFLELGTSKMAPRPFLRSTIDAERTAIETILSKPFAK